MLSLRKYPHKDLCKVASPVDTFDDSLRGSVKQLFDMMTANGWMSLAAPQLGLPLRLFVIALPNQEPLCCINPEIVENEGEISSEENSLSFPGLQMTLVRKAKVKLQYQNEMGLSQTVTADEVGACCIQQNMDHLNGILFIDYLSRLKRSRLLKKYDKYLSEHACHDPHCGHEHA